MGPYFTDNTDIVYAGNNLHKTCRLSDIAIPKLDERHKELSDNSKYFFHLIQIYDCVHNAVVDFMRSEKVRFFSLPTITRMISSPGALNNMIVSDVMPFEFNYFNHKAFLTQSSQLYLELALTLPEINSLYTFEKSFRNETSDFRHLPEFTHVEFEAAIQFEENIVFQKRFFVFMIKEMLEKSSESLAFFLSIEDINELDLFCTNPSFEEIAYIDAFKLLYKKTGNEKYKDLSIQNLGSFEEVLLTEIVGRRNVFITNYIADEVAFYHAEETVGGNVLAKNADFIAAGYGELIGSGERMTLANQILAKAQRFKLNIEDYQSYIEARENSSKVHSGWGMGVERLIHFVLKMPAIWNVTCFPRLSNSIRP